MIEGGKRERRREPHTLSLSHIVCVCVCVTDGESERASRGGEDWNRREREGGLGRGGKRERARTHTHLQQRLRYCSRLTVTPTAQFCGSDLRRATGSVSGALCSRRPGPPDRMRGPALTHPPFSTRISQSGHRWKTGALGAFLPFFLPPFLGIPSTPGSASTRQPGRPSPGPPPSQTLAIMAVAFAFTTRVEPPLLNLASAMMV